MSAKVDCAPSFWSLEDLEQTLILFYEKYNNHRLETDKLNLPPMLFWECWSMNLVETAIDEKEVLCKQHLKIPYHQLSGNMSQREVPPPPQKTLDGFEDENEIEMHGAVTFHQPSV